MAVTGADKLAADLRRASSGIGRQAEQVATKWAVDVEASAKSEAPVDTGTLRNSYRHQVRAGGGRTIASVGSDVEYAPHVEYGTVRQQAQPHLRPAYDRHTPAALVALEEIDPFDGGRR